MKKPVIAGFIGALAAGFIIVSMGFLLSVKPFTLEGKRAIIDDSLRVGGKTTINGELFAKMQTFASPTTVTISNSATFADTLNLSSVIATRIAVKNGKPTIDTVKFVKAPTSGAIYIFSITADDSTVRFTDGGNLKLGAARVLDKASDRLLCISDGTSLFEIAFVSND